MNEATLCAIVKNEGPYLLEWVAYHKLLGFDRIIIYNNDSTDQSVGLLRHMSELGLIETSVWPTTSETSPQISAYNDAISNIVTEWVCFLDADEFLNLRADSTVGSFLSRWKSDVSAIAINWQIFGSAGLKSRRDLPVIEAFTRSASQDHHLNRHCKTFARTKAIDKMHIHRCFLKYGRYVNTDGTDIEIERMGFTPSVKHNIAQINHYIVKSYEEFLEKQARGNANRPLGAVDKYTTRDGDYFAKHDRNEEEDTSIQKFVPSLRQEMEKITRAGLV
jgi:glycosyltransferase involved in cell wall biosynthesis